MPRRTDLKRTSPPLRNEVEATDKTDHAAKAPMGFVVTLIAGLHLLCCGLLLPLLAGVSLATILPSRPAIGVIAAMIGMVGFVWYVRKRRQMLQFEPSPDGAASR